jgi:hypothetical protein
MTAPTLSPGLDPRDDVLDRLAAGLRGPRRVRTELLTELRDGLDDASADLEAAGLEAEEARRQAVADFGDPVLLAHELQAELTGVQARRTALAVALVSPLIETAWTWGYPAMMRGYAMRGGQPNGSQLLGGLNDAQTLAVWIVTPLLLLAYGAMLRRTVALRRAALLIGLLAGGLLSINLVTSGLMTALNPDLIPALNGNPPGLVLQFSTLAALLVLILSTIRTGWLLAFAARPVGRLE